MVTLPDVEEYVIVEVKATSHMLPELFPNLPKTKVYDGFIRPNEAYDPPDTFRLTGNNQMPVRVIAKSKLCKINGEDVIHEKEVEPQVIIVPGSKPGTQYQVTIDGSGRAMCTCSGFGFRHHCKHIDLARAQLSETP